MKRAQLIEYSILIIGLIFGYKFFESILSAIVQIFYSFQNSGDFFDALLPTLLFVAVYAICFVILIKRSGQIATYISKDSANETIAVKIDKRSLLHVILIGIAAVTILSNIAEIILYLFDTFKKEVGGRNMYDSDTSPVSKYQFKTAAVQTIIGLVVLYFSKDICGWFIRKNEADQLTFESTNEN